MKMDKFFNSVIRGFRNNKMIYIMSLVGLSAVLSIIGNRFGMLYLILAILPTFLLGMLFVEERKINDL